MTTTTASAPGKVLIAGEYAVLGGAAAVSMAVDRRAVASVAASDSGRNRLVVRGYGDGEWSFSPADASALEPPGTALPLFECLWRHATLDPERSWVIELDTTPFYDPPSGNKYGLGSSAALCAAAAAVLCPGAEDLTSLVAAAHREFQGGSGSGVDVATALAGGVVRYRMGAPAVNLAWPSGLGFRLLWSGRSATTRLKLERLSAGSGAIDAELIDAANAAAETWAGGDADRVLASLSDYVRRLRAFDLDRDLGIFDAGHWQRTEDAWADGSVVYKPCGAGGGDVGIVFGKDDAALDAFAARATDAGFRLLDVACDTVGLSVRGASVDG